MAKDTTERLYALIANEEDARVCTDIADNACREVPGNFLLMLCSQILTSIGDLLINPKTILAWLIPAIGAPSASRTTSTPRSLSTPINRA